MIRFGDVSRSIFGVSLDNLIQNLHSYALGVDRAAGVCDASRALIQSSSPAGTMQVKVEDGRVSVSFVQGKRAYRAELPMVPAGDGAQPSLSYRDDTDGQKPVVIELSGQEAFNDLVSSKEDAGKFPEQLVALHSHVLSFLRSRLPQVAATALPVGSAAEKGAATAPENSPVANSIAPKVPEYTPMVLERNGQRDLRFEGRLVAGVRSAPVNGRWMEMAVLETKSSKRVGVKTGYSLWRGESDRREVAVLGSDEELLQFFGFTALAKTLYSRLGLDAVETLD